MKVVHLALTPLAGAPIRLVRALRRHTDVDARLINLNPAAYGARRFDEDVDFSNARDEARALIESADLIHLHHWIDLRVNPFGVDLRGRTVLRHLHSQPGHVAAHGGGSIENVLADPLPQLVVAQFHERFYPRARPVPNLLDRAQIEAARAAAAALPSQPLTVCYQPTTDTSACDERWDTKGRPETLAALERLQQTYPFLIDAACDLPHADALARKAAADLVIDELVTGSYHYAGLEGLALGRPTLGHLDARTVATLAALTGSADLPWINVHLSQLPTVLRELAADADLRAELGRTGRAWIERHWDEAVLVGHYLVAYRDVLAGKPLRPVVPSTYSALRLPDLDWLQRTRQITTEPAPPAPTPADPSADGMLVQDRARLEDATGLHLRVDRRWFSVTPHWFWPEFVAGWERDTEKVYAAFMRPDRDVIDVGAWIGPTAMFGLAYGARRVIAIEPNPISVERLLALRDRNPDLASRLLVYAEAAGPCAGEIEFGTPDGRLSDSSACSINGRGWRVPMRPLHEILNGIDGLSPALIKIDVEGAEFTMAEEIRALARFTDAAVLLSLHPPMMPAGHDGAPLLRVLQQFDIIDLDAQPLSHEEVARRIDSDVRHPPWGTRFGNFFEVLLLPRVAADVSTADDGGALRGAQAVTMAC